MIVKIFTVASVPVGLQQQWLQHLRDFDVAHPGCHFQIMADAPNQSFEEMVQMVRVNPGLTFTQIIERGPK